MKKVPNFEIGWPAPAKPRALNIKAVYVVSHSWYGQIIVLVCMQHIPKEHKIYETSIPLAQRSESSILTSEFDFNLRRMNVYFVIKNSILTALALPPNCICRTCCHVQL